MFMDSLLVHDSLDKCLAENMGNFIPSQLESWREQNNNGRTKERFQAEPIAATAQQYVIFSPFSLSYVRQISMGVHLRMMNESFFSIHGVPESINISKKPLCQNFHLFSSFKIFSNFMPYSRDVRSTLHGLLYTKPNLSLWGFTMPKGFGIGQHIREKPGTSKFTRTFGHTVARKRDYEPEHCQIWYL